MILNRTNPTRVFTFIARLSAAVLVYVGYSAAPTPPRAQAEPRTVEVVAKRFEFEPSRIEVTEGQTVKILVRSADGLHGFGIKKFKVSEEVPRGGQPISIEFTATAVGEFEILCSEYCGKGHEAMKGKLVVRARDAGSR
jgi:cytochrome c oxidase subunit II